MFQAGELISNRIDSIPKHSRHVNSLSKKFDRFLIAPVDNPAFQAKRWRDEYLARCQTRGLAKETIHKYRWCLESLVEHLVTENFCDIVAGMESWARAIYKTKGEVTAPSTIGEIATFSNWLLKAGCIKRKPELRIKRPQVLPKALTIGQLRKAHFALAPDMQFLMRFLLATALRIGAVISLRRENFSLDTMTIHAISKSRKLHKVTVNTLLIDECRRRVEALGENERLFPRAIKTYYNRFHYAWDKLGFKVTPHRLRHSFARHFLLNKGSVAALQEILGHSTPTMALHYAAVFSEDALAQQRAINPADLL